MLETGTAEQQYQLPAFVARDHFFEILSYLRFSFKTTMCYTLQLAFAAGSCNSLLRVAPECYTNQKFVGQVAENFCPEAKIENTWSRQQLERTNVENTWLGQERIMQADLAY